MKKNINLYILFIISLLIVSFYYYNFLNLEKQKESKKQLIFENNIKCVTALNITPFTTGFVIKYSEQFNSCIFINYDSIQDFFSKETLFKYDSEKEARINFLNIK